MSGTVEFGGSLTIDPSSTVAVSQPSVQILEVAGFIGVGPRGAPGNVPRVDAPAWSPTITIDWTDIDMAKLTLAGNTVLNFIGTPVDGAKLVLALLQDNVGGWQVTLPANIGYSASLPAPVLLSSDPSKADKLGFIFDQAAGKYDLVAFSKGF